MTARTARDLAAALRVYLVTDRRLYGDRPLTETVTAAVEGGVTVVQLRDPEASGLELYRTGEQLRDLLAGTGVPLIVDDRVDVALAVGADGVHVGQTDLPVARVRDLAGPDLIVGLSTTNPAQVAEALAFPAGTVDYLGVGPVWATTTKADAKAPIGLDGLSASLSAARRGIPGLAGGDTATLPCVAIGGISLDRAPAVAAAGADGIAVISAICWAPDPRAAAARLAEIMQAASSSRPGPSPS